ncbi:MAG TPA: hypothetical protein VJ852_01115 [Gemmatimonadaceae bacterium]|nr:hypothetical protein [Gemmatimonadaceae bacterium]
MERVTRHFGRFAALVGLGVLLTACAKKDNYAADTSAAMVDSSSMSTMSASSTAPAMQDTSTTAAATTKSTTKKSTTKTAPKKTTY